MRDILIDKLSRYDISPIEKEDLLELEEESLQILKYLNMLPFLGCTKEAFKLQGGKELSKYVSNE